MQEAVGTVEHVAGSGRVIVRLVRAVEEGRVLYDSRRSAVARVAELIGPVSAPFASAVPMTSGISRHVGRKVYEQAVPERQAARQGSRRGSGRGGSGRGDRARQGAHRGPRR